MAVWCIVFAFLAGWERRGSTSRWVHDEDGPAQPDELSPEEVAVRDDKMQKVFVLVGLVFPPLGLVVFVCGLLLGW